jgi:phospholipid/cholesterol/gamma-HCH transport system ATP-binding protein
MANAAPENVVSVRELAVELGGVRVLDALNLEARRGEILGIVGGSGAGKSVLLRAIIGLLPKARGTIEVFGVDADTATDAAWQAVERRWGVLFQGGALFSSLSALENVRFAMRQTLAISPRFTAELAMVKLQMVGLTAADAVKLPAELSGGMVKRVALARALALDPEIVFLDEPTSGLDPITAGGFDDLIRTLQDTLGLTVLMVTHDLDTLRSTCDRVIALANGRVAAEGALSAVAQSNHPWVRSYFKPRHQTPAET